MEQTNLFFKELENFKWMGGDLKAFTVSSIYISYCSKKNSSNDSLLKLAKENIKEFKNFKQNDNDVNKLLKTLDELDIENYSIFTNEVLNKLDDYLGISRMSIPSSESYQSDLVAKLLNLQDDDIVLDIGSGYGNFLSYVSNVNSKIKLIGQEINKVVCDCSKMILEMSKSNYSIENIDAIKNDKYPKFTKGFIFPSFGLKYPSDMYEKYQNINNTIFNLKSSCEWLFIYNALNSMEENGKLIAIVLDGVLFKAQDTNFRKYLLENNLIEGIISLPSGFLKGTAIKSNILILSKNNNKFKLFDATPYLPENTKRERISLNNINELYKAYQSCDVLIDKDDIKTIDCNLTYSSITNKNSYEGMKNLVNLNEVVEILKGSNLTISNFKDLITEDDTDYLVLTSSDIDNGLINYKKLKHINNGSKYEKFYAKEGDVIITSKSTKVKLAVINGIDNRKIIVTGAMYILRPIENKIDGTYLKIFFDSSKGRQILESAQKGSVITTISASELENLQVPCPEYTTQMKVTAKYNNLMSMYEVMKKEVSNMENKLANFYDSIDEA